MSPLAKITSPGWRLAGCAGRHAGWSGCHAQRNSRPAGHRAAEGQAGSSFLPDLLRHNV